MCPRNITSVDTFLVSVGVTSDGTNSSCTSLSKQVIVIHYIAATILAIISNLFQRKGSFTGTLLSKNFSVYYAGGNWAAPALNCGCFCAFEVSYQTQRRRKMFHIVFRRTSCILRFAITLEFLNHLAGCAELKSILIYFHHLTR